MLQCYKKIFVQLLLFTAGLMLEPLALLEGIVLLAIRRGLFARAKGGFYHDGRFADLSAVVEHYDQHFGLDLTPAEKTDLVEYLKSL